MCRCHKLAGANLVLKIRELILKNIQTKICQRELQYLISGDRPGSKSAQEGH